MDLRAEPEVRASFQDLSGLVGREVPSVDECITEVREPIRRNRRQHLFPDEIDVGLGPGLEFWRTAWAPRKVGTTSISAACPAAAMARRFLSSSSVRSPYPLLASTVVVPEAAIDRRRFVASRARSHSEDSRVARTVSRIPHPPSAISE